MNGQKVDPIRFVAATRYPLKAALFTVRHPSLWPYCITPVLINIAVLVVVWHFLGVWMQDLIHQYLGDGGWLWKALRWIVDVFAFVLRVLATLIAFVVVGNIAAVPFNDFLSERVDALVLGWKDTRPLQVGRKTREILTVILQESKRLAIYLCIMVILFVLSFIPLLTPFTTLAQILVTATFFSLDYLSYPLERRGLLLLDQKFRFTKSHMSSSLGFGAAMTLIGLIPLVNFLFFPLGVVGGTLMFADLYRRDPSLGRMLPG